MLVNMNILIFLISILINLNSIYEYKINNSFLGSIKNQEESIDFMKPNNDIKFIRETVFGETEKNMLGEIGDVAVDNSDRVFIVDKDQKVIHVYKPDGRYLTSIGREGKGPGEFMIMGSVKIYSNKLYASDGDRLLRRVEVYSLKSLSFSQTLDFWAKNHGKIKELRNYVPVRFYPIDKDFIVAYAQPGTDYLRGKSFIRYYKTNQNGKIITGKILEQENLRHLVYRRPNGGTIGYTFSFLKKSLFAMAKNGHFYIANSNNFKIYVYDNDGRKIQILQHPFPKRKLTRMGLIEQYKQKDMSFLGNDVAVKMIRNANNLPSYWPVLSSMFVDDQNRLWVSTIIENNKVYEWWVLKKTGEVISKFKWPRDKPIKQVRNGYMYTLESDQKTGIQKVVKYKIKMY